jgi:hypothetical protein
MENPCGCAKQYFTNPNNLSYRLNTIPLVSDSGDQTTPMTITFPNPFLLVGFGDSIDVPVSSPNYERSNQIISNPLVQNTYSDLFLTMFIAFAEANMNDLNLLDPTVYNSGAFRYYMSRFINNDLVPMNYNSFTWPESLVKRFWFEVNAVSPLQFVPIFMNFMQNLMSVGDKRLWGAPGTYVLNPQDGVFNEWNRCFDERVLDPSLQSATLCNYFNPPTIPLNTNTKAYIMIGSGLTGVQWGSLTVPYAGIGPHSPNWTAFPGDPASAIAAWIIAVLTAETGDAPQPFGNYPAPGITTYSVSKTAFPIVPLCSSDIPTPGIQVTTVGYSLYGFGTLALPVSPGGHRIYATFRDTYSPAPYWDQLVAWNDDQGGLPQFVTLELLAS